MVNEAKATFRKRETDRYAKVWDGVFATYTDSKGPAQGYPGFCCPHTITKTHLFKYVENFTSKNLKIFR